jgi:hypothetical protein
MKHLADDAGSRGTPGRRGVIEFSWRSLKGFQNHIVPTRVKR